MHFFRPIPTVILGSKQSSNMNILADIHKLLIPQFRSSNTDYKDMQKKKKKLRLTLINLK